MYTCVNFGLALLCHDFQGFKMGQISNGNDFGLFFCTKIERHVKNAPKVFPITKAIIKDVGTYHMGQVVPC